MTRAEAFIAILAQPDPPDIHRGCVQTVEGKPDRGLTYQDLPMRYVVHARIAKENERHA